MPGGGLDAWSDYRRSLRKRLAAPALGVPLSAESFYLPPRALRHRAGTAVRGRGAVVDLRRDVEAWLARGSRAACLHGPTGVGRTTFGLRLAAARPRALWIPL